ncbi:MAG TPA: SMI1/KNR4 family protein [Terriglobales bacterium]|nr:SMI1/KNR4 family protein [Terriglobales bacterium]
MKITLKNGCDASESSIRALEMELGYPLSDSYKTFVHVYDGAKPETNIFRVSHINECGVSKFIPVAEITKQKSRIEGFPEHACPIASAEGGNFIFLDENGAVFFWDHEVDDEPVRLAGDFGSFLDSLEPFDVKSVQLKPGQVKRVWVDREFLKKLKK